MVRIYFLGLLFLELLLLFVSTWMSSKDQDEVEEELNEEKISSISFSFIVEEPLAVKWRLLVLGRGILYINSKRIYYLDLF
jgi:hypothetical protein